MTEELIKIELSKEICEQIAGESYSSRNKDKKVFLTICKDGTFYVTD